MVTRIASSIRAHPWAVLLAAAYLAMGIIFSVVNPIHEATDELRHYRYVRYIADLGQLPVQSEGQGNAQAHHPPLYYATAALVSLWVHPPNPLYEPPTNPHWGYRNWEVGTDNKNLYLHGPDEAWPYRGHALAAHLARWVTLMWGAAAVILTYSLAANLFPSRPSLASTATALVSFNAMFLYLGAAVNNDVPAGLVGAAITLACMYTVRDGLNDRRAVVLGILYGIGSLVKFNLVAMLAVIQVALVVSMWVGATHASSSSPSFKRKTFDYLRANGIILGIALVISGWWYARNTMLYGEPTGFLRVTEIWGFRNPQAGTRLAGRDLLYAWTSLWGRFGYGQIPLPNGFYIAPAVLCGLGLAGLAAFLIARRRVLSLAQWGMIAVLSASALINLAVLYAYIIVSPAGAMGRFLFPGLPAFAVLIATGLTGLLPQKAQSGVAVATSMLMLGLTGAALIGYLAPAYAIPVQVEAPAKPLDIRFGSAARILAYQVTPDTIRRGEPIDVAVTWEVLEPTDVPYAVFVQVFDQQDIPIAQRDTYTGLGNYPSNWWRPGHIFTETYRVYIPETTLEPALLRVRLGLYHPERGRLPVSDPSAIDSALALANVNVEQGTKPPLFINWENHFALVDFYVDPRVVHPGERVFVTLHWLALDPPRDEDYKVFVHIMQGWTNFAGRDGSPVSPDTRTREWIPGQVYYDERRITLPEDIPPGLYQIELGWFSDKSGERLNIVAEDGHIIDNWLPLNIIRVIPHDENP